MKSMRWMPVLFILGLALPVCRPVSLSAAPFAYITNSGDNTVSVLDTATNTVTATVPVGTNPQAVAVSPDGTRVYVSNAAIGSVSILDTATNTVVATVSVGSGPFGLAVTPDGGRVYVSNYNDYTVSVIDTATNTVATTLPIGKWPCGVAVAPDGSRVYVGVYGDDSVAILDTATNTVTATVPVGTAPWGLALTPDGAHLYVANYLSNDVSVISTATNTVTATVPVAPNPHGIAVTPDGAQVYVANFAASSVWVLATASNTAIAAVPVGGGADGVATTPDGERVYVVNYWDNTVSVIATATNTVTDTVPVGTKPVAFGQFIRPPSPATPPPLTVTSLSADKASPQVAGTAITFTATATGGVAPYQYQWWVHNGTTWTVGQAWSPSNTFAWTPTAPGSYLLQVWARSSGITADTAEAYKQIAYTITAPPPLSVTSLTATPASPQVEDTPVTFTATATGGVAPVQYKWWIGYGCALGGPVAHVCWDVLQDWGTSPTVVWRAWQGLSVQRIQVWARSGGNTADTAEAYKEIIYTVTRNVPTVTSLTADQAAPQPIRTPITFTATATGGVAPVQYKWWVFNGSTWSVGQAWSAGNTFAWTPTAPGSYLLQVWARNSGTTTDMAEAYRQVAYTITPPPPLSVPSVTPDRPSPQPEGTTITFTATATGGVAPIQYKWWLYNGRAWSVGQPWSTSTTFAWMPTVPGAYTIQVWARNAGTTTDTAEAYRQVAYTVAGGVALTVTSVTPDKPSPQVAGTPITLTATATGGVAPYQYKWWVEKGGVWTVGRDWGTGNTVAWTPSNAGSYTLQVWARSHGSTAETAEAYRQVSYTVTAPPPLTVTGVTPDKAAPQVVGTPITFTAAASGGVAPYQYKWWGLYRCPIGIGAAIDCWLVDQDWGTSNTFTLTGRTERTSTFQVWARSVGSTADTAEAYRQFSYTWTLPPPLSVTSLTADKTSPQPIGTAITFTATATSGVAPYQYKWWVYNGTTWSVGQDWGTNTTFAWTPTAPGSYLLQVWARNSGTTTDTPEAYGQLAYMVSPPPR
jgi:YVTN family beta-propeller protein